MRPTTTPDRPRRRDRAATTLATAARPAVPRRPAALADERRMRAAGGPEDNATYRCGCGFVFQAAVSTGVTCPHCGTGQAW